MDSIKKLNKIEKATDFNRADFVKLGFAFLFILVAAGISFYSFSAFSAQESNLPSVSVVVIAAMVGGYMAMNIGANDVANNVGPAVGSKALSMGGAIFIAAVCEALGAIVAGGDVVDTIRSGIISTSTQVFEDRTILTNVMLSALFAAAIWLHLATALGAPVSTTHSIVGGILGGGVMAGGFEIVNWSAMGNIAMTWVISPVLGGGIAAMLLFFIKRTITYQEDKLRAARRIVPLLLCGMGVAFSMYMIDKGLSKIIELPLPVSIGISLGIGALVFAVCNPLITKASLNMQNTKEDIGKFFTLPLISAAALLSFAHGSNDVANAIGPLAAINDLASSVITAETIAPLWIMIIGAAGIAIGLALYGPKLIRTVGSEITDLDQIRAFCVAMSAAITVLVASALGLPVSSTHIAVGAVFGVGFLRENIKKRYHAIEQSIIEAYDENADTQAFLETFRKASLAKKQLMLKAIKQRRQAEKSLEDAGIAIKADGHLQILDPSVPLLTKKEQKKLKRVYKEELVKRSAFNKIIATWIITLPIAAIVSAIIFFILTLIGIKY